MNVDQCAAALRKDKITIFLLHGVISSNPWKYRNYNRKHILDTEFIELLKNLTALGSAISMQDVLKYCTDGGFPENAFAITFDDGFENNLSIAAPILQSFAVPATFYITSSFVEQNLMSWVDRIDWAVEASAENTEYSLDVPWLKNKVLIKTRVEKLEFLEEVRKHAKVNPAIDQNALASSIQRQFGLPLTYASNSEIDLKLSWHDVRKLNETPYFTIGGHTHSHPIMSFLDKKTLRDEIRKCLRLIEKNADISTNHFSYPEGLTHTYNNTVVSTLREFGINCCPSAEPGYNAKGTDTFELKRIFVH